MSTFTNYESNPSSDYDTYRIPSGTEIIAGLIQKHAPVDQVEDAKVLDLGCGTGSYPAVLFSEYQIGKNSQNVLVDASNTMLNQAKAKMAKKNIQNIDYHQVFLPKVPLKSDQFDVITNTMVLHHLPSVVEENNDPNKLISRDMSKVEATIKEVSRMLKPKGVFVCVWATPEQCSANWYTGLTPDSFRRISNRCPTATDMMNFCEKYGLKIVAEWSMMEGSHYIGYENIRNLNLFMEDEKAWMMDSGFSGALDHELAGAKEMYKKLHAEGKLKEFADKWNKARDVGVGRILCAVKQ